MSVAYQPKPVSILVLQRGWVAVGHVSKDGSEVVMENAAIIRRWGTTKGLGQIAANGPTASTVLDPVGRVSVHELGVVLRIECAADKWAVIDA